MKEKGRKSFMKELVVISGKGGTGKTSLLAAFASLAKEKVLCDADVDAADLHLIMDPRIEERHDFESGHEAVINRDMCTQCGLCRELCRWNAISEDFIVDPIACEGCGVCYYFCPEKAIEFPLKTCGEWYLSDTRFGPMAHARLGIAEENSGKLVSLIRQGRQKTCRKEKPGSAFNGRPSGDRLPGDRFTWRGHGNTHRGRTHGFGEARHGAGGRTGRLLQGTCHGLCQQV